MATTGVKDQLGQLLGRLEERSAEGYGRTSFRAKAIGKTKDSIHLAVETGIVSVPLSEIEGIKQLSQRDPTVIRVEVRNGDRITHLRRVPDPVRYPVTPDPINPGFLPPFGPFTWPPRFGPLGWPNVGQEDDGASTSTSTDDGIDTTTSSNGEADQTDDHRGHYHGDTD